MSPPIPVGVRLPLATPALGPQALLGICRHALGLGYASFWVGDHVLLPETSTSTYPHTSDGEQPFRADTPWLDPLLALTWLAAQLPDARFGTSVLILTLRRAALVAKQLATVSWLTRQPFTLGVGTGWLREEYLAVGAAFEGRARRARADLAEIRDLVDGGARSYAVDETVVEFAMRPVAPAPVRYLWGGVSPRALRLVAECCDGWLPAKQSPEALGRQLALLDDACARVGRDRTELDLVVKPGSGPDPEHGAIDRATLDRYAELGFREAVLELPYDADGAEARRVLDRVAARTWT